MDSTLKFHNIMYKREKGFLSNCQAAWECLHRAHTYSCRYVGFLLTLLGLLLLLSTTLFPIPWSSSNPALLSDSCEENSIYPKGNKVLLRHSFDRSYRIIDNCWLLPNWVISHLNLPLAILIIFSQNYFLQKGKLLALTCTNSQSKECHCTPYMLHQFFFL